MLFGYIEPIKNILLLLEKDLDKEDWTPLQADKDVISRPSKTLKTLKLFDFFALCLQQVVDLLNNPC